MARAGHQLALIQLFGRWGSTTVMKYVHEAALGSAGGNIAQFTERLGTPLMLAEENLLGRQAKVPQLKGRGAAVAWSDKAM